MATGSPQQPARIFRFGQFELSEREGELRKNGVRIKLQEQPFRVLLELVANAGKVVSRKDLQQKLWPADTFVDFDVGLNTAIRKLRGALSDDADNPRYIETLARRGYRFVAAVTDTAAAADAGAAPVALQGVQRGAGVLHRRRLWLSVSSLALIAVFAVGWYLLRRSTTPGRPATERQITANPPENWVRSGAISPDGKFVAYQDWTGLYVRLVESGETLSVRVPAELMKQMSGLSWSPGGGKLLTSVPGRDGDDIWEITVMGEAEPKLPSATAGSRLFCLMEVLSLSPEWIAGFG